MITASTVALQASSRSSILLASTKREVFMSDNCEDQLKRIRNITSDLKSIMDDLDAAFNTANFKYNKADIAIREKVKAIVASS